MTVLFNNPLLTLFDRTAFASGVALLYIYASTSSARLLALQVLAFQNK